MSIVKLTVIVVCACLFLASASLAGQWQYKTPQLGATEILVELSAVGLGEGSAGLNRALLVKEMATILTLPTSDLIRLMVIHNLLHGTSDPFWHPSPDSALEYTK